MLRAAWLGAVQADVALESIPTMLDRLLVDQADREASKMATVCLVEVDPEAQQLRIVRAGHDSPLLITRESVTALNRVHGPALGLGGSATWPVRDVDVPAEAALMLFTDGLTERRPLGVAAGSASTSWFRRSTRRCCSTGRPSRRSTRCSSSCSPMAPTPWKTTWR